MFNNIVNLFGSVFQTPQVRTIAPVKQNQNYNPFAGNPFMSQNNQTEQSYGKNKPVNGGYFAGYHNGKPNIVGTRLFLEV